LAVTWACKRLRGYLSGLDFTIRTDHKPLITLLKSRPLDDLPPRIIRFRLRLLRFTFSIIHVPGKNLITADACPERHFQPQPQQDLEKECKASLDSNVESLPATPTKLEHIKTLQTSYANVSVVTLQRAGLITDELCMSSYYLTGLKGQSCMMEEDCL